MLYLHSNRLFLKSLLLILISTLNESLSLYVIRCNGDSFLDNGFCQNLLNTIVRENKLGKSVIFSFCNLFCFTTYNIPEIIGF